MFYFIFAEINSYIKTKFVYQSVGVNKNLGTYGCGSLTDGEFKIEVRINDFKNNLNFQKGSAVAVTERIHTQGNYI